MFTGIIEETGSIAAVTELPDARTFRISAQHVLDGVTHGDSIAVNGVCLTVIDPGPDSFSADVMAETLRRSSLGGLAAGSPVNLERAARVDARIGGHIVQGHVDGVATVREVVASDNWTTVRFELPDGRARYVVEKGSITVDGVSLTVVDAEDTSFSVSLIPTTLAHTTLGSRRVGDRVNIEDFLTRYYYIKAKNRIMRFTFRQGQWILWLMLCELDRMGVKYWEIAGLTAPDAVQVFMDDPCGNMVELHQIDKCNCRRDNRKARN